MQKLFTVEDCFMIAGRGVVITGQPESNSPAIKIGEIILLVRPDKKEVFSEIVGIEWFRPITFPSKKLGVLVKNVEKKDAPRGTEVFLKT
jgi:translation elongation factor EF-Tu-like GTPase